MIPTTARCIALALGLGLFAACQSTEAEIPDEKAAAVVDQPIPYDPKVWDKGEPEPIGSFLANLDKSMRAWTNLTLTAQTRADRTKARMLQESLMSRVHARQQELVDVLESGPPRNRAIAAGALGFSASKDVLGPLVVALTDKESEVVQNAALSLALLQNPETPMLALLEVLQGSSNGNARANAAYAVRSILEAGATADENVIKAARHALVDEEPFAQAQGALILAIAKDGESIPDLGELLQAQSPLVIGAAMQALLALGRGDPKLLGPTARALVTGMGIATEQQRPAIQRALVLLSGHNYEYDLEKWTEWSQRLP